MSQQDIDAEQSYENDRWLTNLFASASGPLIDAAFVERITNRLRRRARLRLLILFTTGTAAALITLWQISGLALAVPSPNFEIMKIPDWLSSSQTTIAATGILIAVFFMWMIAEDA
ncbi:MAG: hypothetical protein RIC29_17930 [Rhodospirillaceae bacterium]